MYAKSLLLYPANGRGLPTANCCTMTSVSGSADDCAGPYRAVSIARSTAVIAALFCRASAIRACRLTGTFCVNAALVNMEMIHRFLIFVIFPHRLFGE